MNAWQTLGTILGLVRRERPQSRGMSIRGLGAGMLVDEYTALNHATVWACVRIIAETGAHLGWHVLQEGKDGETTRVRGSGIEWLLNVQSNPEMTAFNWRQTALVHALLAGNHYSEIERDVTGRPLNLWPLNPHNVRPWRNDAGELLFKVFQQDGGEVDLAARNVYHVPGLGWDGLLGYSVVTMAARSIGFGLAMDEYGANFYANGTHLGLVFEHPRSLKPEQKTNIQESLDNRSGSNKAFRAMIVEDGMKLSKATMSMIDAQFLESRKLQVSEICRWFRVPPHKVADLDRATFSNIEQQSIEFVQDTMLPWCARLEQEANTKLFGRTLQRTMRTRINVDTLQRGDFKTRQDGYAAGRSGGWLSVNDIRRMEGMNAIGPEGDIYLQPLNMVPAGTPVDTGRAPVEPKLDPDEIETDPPANNVIRSDKLSWHPTKRTSNA